MPDQNAPNDGKQQGGGPEQSAQSEKRVNETPNDKKRLSDVLNDLDPVEQSELTKEIGRVLGRRMQE